MPRLTTCTLFANIFPSLSKMLDLKFFFFTIFWLTGISLRLNNIILEEKMIVKIKNIKKINAILSKDIFR